MNVTHSLLLDIANQRVCSAKLVAAEIQDWTVDFLAWAYLIAPESAVIEVSQLSAVGNLVNPDASGVAELTVHQDAYKVLSVYQSQVNTLLSPRYRMKFVSPERLQAVIDNYPPGTKVYAKTNSLWSYFGKNIRAFCCEPGWYVGLEYLQLPIRTWTSLAIPTGWDVFIALYAGATWHLRDEEPELAMAYFAELKSEMGRFGIYYDEAPHIAGGGNP